MNPGSTSKNSFLKNMKTTKRSFLPGVSKTHRLALQRFSLVLALGLAFPALTSAAPGDATTGKVYATPEEAVAELKVATSNADTNAIRAIFGPAVEDLQNADRVQATNDYAKFSAALMVTNHLVHVSDTNIVIEVGEDLWPFPIPLVSKNGAWYFDSETGTQEIKFRRIGENEATAIQVCEEFAMAKNEAEAKVASEDPITQFVQSLASAAAANADNKESNPFHGYYFRIVAPNPASGVSGRGKRTGGLTLVAYPAGYQSSGVKTFVVTQKGVVFEKDLGPGTTTVAPQMKARTGSSWHPAA